MAVASLGAGPATNAPEYKLTPPAVHVRGPLATIPLPDQAASIQFSPDGKTLLTAKGHDYGRRVGPLRAWDVGSGRELFAVAKGWKEIETVLFSPDSSILAAHEKEGDLKLWDARTGKELAVVSAPTQNGNWVNFCFSPDGRLLAVQDYGCGVDADFIRFWDVSSKKDVGSIEGYFWTMSISPDSRTAATFTRKDHAKVDRIMLWSLADGKVSKKLKEMKVSADDVAVSPDLASFATANLPAAPGTPTQLALWDMASGASRASISYDTGDTHIQNLAFLAGGKVLWASGGGGHQLSWHTKDTFWDVSGGTRLLKTASFAVRPVWSSDHRFIAVPKDNGALLYLGQGMKKRGDMTNASDVGPSYFGSYNNIKFYPSVKFSPDGRLAVVTGLHILPKRGGRGHSGPVARLWDTETGREVMSFPDCKQTTFSPDGTILATVEGEAVRLWGLTP
jgi:WD40 repeat protein